MIQVVSPPVAPVVPTTRAKPVPVSIRVEAQARRWTPTGEVILACYRDDLLVPYWKMAGGQLLGWCQTTNRYVALESN